MANEKIREAYAEWYRISNTPGWKAYAEELKKIITSYEVDMDNDNIDGDGLKRLQLIKKGLKLAYDLPKQMEIRSRTK